MPRSQKLPEYFKVYLDEKFDHTNDKINGVDEKVGRLEEEFKTMNGNLSETMTKLHETNTEAYAVRDKYIPIIEGAVKASKKNSEWTRRLGVGILVGSVIWIKESRDFIIKFLTSLITGF